ncbi:helix-turn-helix domain-containing protein [Azospirillum sp. ST 5-10]|uniref:helix-turn-helix domain-containing protein n=1 Tax=unclassified Azospirillum TaxID=2630922 RepID=UPI003F4A56A8
MHDITLLPLQCRAARGILGWDINDLSTATGLTRKTISDFENGKTGPQPRTLRDIRHALETAGVEFINAGATSAGGGAGVRLREGQTSQED